jgi:glycosyltransferase involved in cell wall biosynthesis
MKIALVAPGEIDIPPTGWGALETVVWAYYTELKKLSYDVEIINKSDSSETHRAIENFDPDIVHLHYGKHYNILPFINRRKIITNHDGSFLNSHQFHEQVIRQFMYDCEFNILTSWEKELLLKIGFPAENIRIVPNGVDYNSFNRNNKPTTNSSICLGKIDSRKNQSFLQKLQVDIVFVGANADPNFNPLDKNYLGLWNREDVFTKLTDYTNLVLLSQSELQPLVCLEALSAGLGLVISEQASQNLDHSLPFISVIPYDKIYDNEYVSQAVIKNRDYCLSISRNMIYEYAQSFDWSNIIQQYINIL